MANIKNKSLKVNLFFLVIRVSIIKTIVKSCNKWQILYILYIKSADFYLLFMYI